jgi:hypothetical protein
LFGAAPVGAPTINPDLLTAAERIYEIEILGDNGACQTAG